MEIKTNQLRSIRAKFNLGQKDLAKVIDCTEATFSRKEKGHSKFTINEAKEITNYINSFAKDNNYIMEDIFF